MPDSKPKAGDVVLWKGVRVTLKTEKLRGWIVSSDDPDYDGIFIWHYEIEGTE